MHELFVYMVHSRETVRPYMSRLIDMQMIGYIGYYAQI